MKVASDPSCAEMVRQLRVASALPFQDQNTKKQTNHKRRPVESFPMLLKLVYCCSKNASLSFQF